MRFYDMTINAGAICSTRTHESSSLYRGAVQVFTSLLNKGGDKFTSTVPSGNGVELKWVDEDGAGAACFIYDENPVTMSYLLTGKDKEADEEVMETLQRFVIKLFHPLGIEPSWDAKKVKERPVILTIIMPSATLVERGIVELIADMETCLAAAYFEKEEN